jgi:hypothetical protein
MPVTASDAPLRLRFQPTDEEVYEPDFLLEAPLVRFVAYEPDRRLFGWVSLAADRLTDLLNAHDELRLEDVEVVGFDGEPATEADEVLVRCPDLVAVHASGPRGDETQREKTNQVPVALRSGSYLIAGHLHAAAGTDPLEALGDRPAMVPLTDAWIECWIGDERRYRATGTIIVNRRRIDSIEQIPEGELRAGRLRGRSPATRRSRPPSIVGG